MLELLGAGIVFSLGLFLFVRFLKKLLAWMDDRGWITYTGNVPTYGSLGNAFLELQSMAQPEKTYLLEQKKEEKTEEDEEGGPDKAGTPKSS